jgi:hypothetical protein
MVKLRRRDFIKVLVLVLTLCSVIRPAFASPGFWDEEIRNPMGVCRYRVSYVLPDTIATNTSELVQVTFEILQLAGLTQAVKTQSIEMQVSAKSGTWETTVANEVRELKTNDAWGPFQYRFKLLDSDFNLNPQEAVTAKISISVKFRETWFGGESDHSATKSDINVELRSPSIPTPINWLETIVTMLGPWLLPIAITVAITVAVSISITIVIGGARRRSR